MELADAVLRQIRSHHTFEACVEQLATAIRLGVFPAGGFLPTERDLAEKLKVSRATVREAIAALRSAGMVETVRGRGGGTVVTFTPSGPRPEALEELAGRRAALRDALTFRRIVEPGAAAVAAGGPLSPADRALLTDCAAAVADSTDSGAHRQADSRLHLAIATVTASPMIVDAVTRVQADLHLMLTSIPVLSANIGHSRRQHDAVVAAILAGDAATARRVMEQHCDDTAALLRGLLGLDP